MEMALLEIRERLALFLKAELAYSLVDYGHDNPEASCPQQRVPA